MCARKNYFLIGVIPPQTPPRAGAYGEGWLIAFIPDDQRVTLFEGPSPHFHSPVKSIEAWFEFQPKYVVTQEGKNSLVVEPPGWFERKLKESHCDWFLPIARRIAIGERVPIEEITAAYSGSHDGQSMLHGSIEELFLRRYSGETYRGTSPGSNLP